MSDWLYKHFTKEEMQCKGDCNCGGLPSWVLMEKLEAMRIEAAFPFAIASGYRCSQYNVEVSTTGPEGPHTLGLAADIKIYGAKAYKLVELAIKHGMTGIGLQQKGDFRTRYIHIDCISSEDNYPRPGIWTY